jgi:predicted DNA-binding ribbon-helix-helix protein
VRRDGWAVSKRSVVLGGHKTSVSLEDAFWDALRDAAAGSAMTASALVAAIDARREHGNLSSAIRLFVLDCYRERIAAMRGRAEQPLAP